MLPGLSTPGSPGPRRLEPSFREKVWGATRLEPWFPNSSRKIGEVWFESAEEAPLLIKFLFTSERLSVQVHPDDAFAHAHHQPRGKTEMWHVLAAEPGAKIAAGFHQPITLERARAAAISGEIEDLLEWFDAAPGDTFFIPAGTVHSIGAGLVLCEIQEMSDVTYRLYDYGRPRELHLDLALAVSRLEPHAARQQQQGDRLVSCRHFVTDLIEVPQRLFYRPSPDRAQLLIAIEGQGTMGGQSLKSGEVWSVTPDVPPFEITGEVRFLRTSLP